MQFIRFTEKFSKKPTILNIEHISRATAGGDFGSIITMILPSSDGYYRQKNIHVAESIDVVSEAILSVQAKEDNLRQGSR